MLDHDQGVAEVLELDEGVDEPAVVTLVETDARLVEDVEHAGQPGTDLRRETDALGFATGQSTRTAREREVVQPDLEQELETGPDLAEDRRGDVGLALGEPELSMKA